MNTRGGNSIGQSLGIYGNSLSSAVGGLGPATSALRGNPSPPQQENDPNNPFGVQGGGISGSVSYSPSGTPIYANVPNTTQNQYAQLADENQNSATKMGQALGAESYLSALPQYGAQQAAAQGLGGTEQGLAAWGLGQQAPSIQDAQAGQLAQAQRGLGAASNQYNGLAQSYGGLAGQEQALAKSYGNLPNAAQAQYQGALGQSLDANLALAHSATGGAIGQAGAQRNAQQQNALTTAGAAGNEAVQYAQNRATALAGQGQAYQGQGSAYQGQGSAYAGQVGAQGQLGQLGLSQYQTAQGVNTQQAQLQAQNLAQGEGFATSELGQAQNALSFQGNQLNNQTGEATQVGNMLGGLQAGQQNANSNSLSAVAPYVGAGLSAIGAVA
jgi:hypothetical protein